MKFFSTRGQSKVDCAAKAIAQGLADDGGLFVPATFPNLSSDIKSMLDMDYAQRACHVLSSYLTEYNKDELLQACKDAYSTFEEGDAAPLVKLDQNLYVLELFHGPTLAFKDIALTILPYLLRKGCDISGISDRVLILVATSGDTGKAALEGFKDKDGIDIMVFYPSEGVSDMQKLQMCTQEGSNVNVVAVKGNFDDCQTAVKRIFSSAEFASKLKENGIVLSSANSINFGRLCPQISYYFSAYCDLVNAGEIELGSAVDFTVPTGNFGNILAGYYAKKMGLPINKLICASNSNNVLTEFFISGTYDANREFFKTMSPSMDILISSNLERLIFEMSDRNAKLTASRMNELKVNGRYSISADELKALSNEFYANYCDEQDCLETISDVFEEYGYVADPHTAVALEVTFGYKEFSGSQTANVVLSTASPYKFSQNVLKAITGKNQSEPFKCAQMLLEETACPIPEQITALKAKQKRFSKVIAKDQTEQAVLEFVSK